jgi:hypothetical protein
MAERNIRTAIFIETLQHVSIGSAFDAAAAARRLVNSGIAPLIPGSCAAVHARERTRRTFVRRICCRALPRHATAGRIFEIKRSPLAAAAACHNLPSEAAAPVTR